MFSFLRKPTRSTATRQSTRTSRLAKAWLSLSTLERREVPATFTVSNLMDGPVASAGALPGSLRQAIFDANALAGADIIDLTGVAGTIAMSSSAGAVTFLAADITSTSATSFTVTDATGFLPGMQVSINAEVMLISGVAGTTLTVARGQNGTTPATHGVGATVTSSSDLGITGSTTFNGPGANILTIDAGGNSRHFVVSDGTASVINVAMNNMRLIGGVAPNNSGGSIRIYSENVSLDSMVLTGNNATALSFQQGGGAIAGEPGTTLSINNSTIANNLASGNGGAIHFGFPASAGPYNQLTITNSTLSGNVANLRGGAVSFNHYTGKFGGAINISNTTISNNKTLSEFAGALYITGTPSSMTLYNSTIANNIASAPGGGGLVLNQGTGTIYIVNSIIANNGNTPAAPDLLSFTNAKFVTINSLIGSIAGVPGTGFVNVSGNTIGPAALAILANNGGSTQTLMPLPGVNAAVDAGIASYQFTTLSAAALVGDTTMKVTANTNLSAGVFLKIDSEVVRVTAVSGTTITVTRGQEGTTAAAHANAAGVLLNFGLTANDQRGAGFPRVQGANVDIGAIEVNPTAPFAVASAPNIVTAGGTSVTVNVVYTAVSPATVNLATIDTGDIRLIGPGYSTPAVPNAAPIIAGSGGSVTVTYTFDAPPAPGGAWDYTDNGVYTVVLQTGQVSDSNAVAINTDNIGQFTAAIGRSLVVTSAADAGPGSLREAIDNANLNLSVTDSITFDTIQMGTNIIPLATSIAINDPVVINQGGPAITLDGQTFTRHLTIDGIGSINVAISKLSFIQGSVTGGFGGSIQFSNENVTFTDCVFAANTADGAGFLSAEGGAIAGVGINGGSLTLVRCTFDDNKTTAGNISSNGGAIFLGGDNASVGALYDLTIIDSTFTNNKGWVNGGAIHMGSGSLNISGSTFFNNSAGSGGAIRMIGTVNANGFNIRNTTITGNTGSTGGGIYLNLQAGNSTRFLIANSTIVNNTALSGAGGGINAQTSYASQLDLENTILSSNTAKTVAPNLSSSKLVVANNSFISIYDDTTGKVAGVNNQLGTKLSPLDPLLAPLANNGGPTQTHRPYGGAPVTDWSVAVPNLTTITSAMLATGTTMAVASTANLVVGMWVQVDSEIMLVQSITGLNVTVLRGGAGTTGAAHSIGAVVTIGYTQPTFDQRGVGFPRIDGSGKVDIGSVEVLSTAPSAKLTAAIPTITSPTASPVIFQVTFADNVALDVASIINNNNAILVTGPNGFSGTATYVTIDNNTNGTPRTATYSLAAPGGTWDLDGSENGVYTISIQPMQVSDTSAEFVEGHPLGTFSVFFGTTFTVTNDNDTGAGSLRSAIEAANNNILSTDTITFSAFFSTPRTIKLDLGELVITDPVVIAGPGAKFATVQGVTTRIMTIDTTSFQNPVTITGLTFTAGTGTGASTTVGGGAILLVDEALTLDGVVITGNKAVDTTSFNGGGILVSSPLASLNVINSVLSNNMAGGSGGAISISAGSAVAIRNSTLSNNSTGQFGSGGAIDVVNQSVTGFGRATITLDNSSFINNNAGSNGGGGLRMGNGSTSKIENVTYLTINNSTFAGNTTSGNGGGLSVGNNVVFTMMNSTVTGNVSRLNGGGIALPTISSIYGLLNGAIINSVIAGNKNKINPDIAYGNATVTHNLPVINSLIGIVDTSLNKLNFINSQFGTPASPLDPQLGPAVNNGGVASVPTQLPRLTSPLLNAGTANPVVVVTTLNGAMTAAQTTMPLTNAFTMLIGQYYQIGTEVVRVVSVTSGPTVTVTRGELGTTAATHTAADPVIRAVTIQLTNLTASIVDNLVNTVTVAGSGPLYVGSSFQVDAEIMTVISVVSPTSVQVLRGQQGTTAAAHANGALVSRPMSTTDQRGIGFPRTLGAAIDIGSVELDATLPQAAGTFATVTAPQVGDHTVTITFTDDVALNVASIKNNNAIRVLGPGGYNVLASYVPGSISVDSNGTPRSAQYKFTPPVNGGAGWDYTDNGSYTINIEPNQVADSNGNFVFGTTVNSLNVAIGRSFLVTNDLDQGSGSLRQAILDSNDNLGVDTINFDPTFFNVQRTINVGPLGEMFITDPVSIVGLGAVGTAIDGGTVNRILNISLPAAKWGEAVNISGLTFSQGGGKNTSGQGGNGGAINNESAALNISDSVFTLNGNGSNSGGAINLNSTYAPLTITNSRFENTNGFSGQVIFNNSSNFVTGFYDQLDIVIGNSTFTQNISTATSTAGGVFNISTGVNLTISNSTFSNNAAGTGSGSGGVLVAGTNTKVNITDSVFENNNAGTTGNGGAIAVNSTGAIVNIQRSTFSGNAAGNATATSGGSGGAIFVSGANTVTLDASTLTGNFSNSSSTVTTSGIGGGAMYLTGAAQVTITNSTLHGNTAALNGGGININNLTNSATPSLAGSLVIRNSTIAYNFASGNGGGINFRTSTSGTPNVSITSSIVSENAGPGVVDLRSGTGNATTGFTVNNSFIGVLTGATITGANNKNTATDGAVNLSPTLALNGAPAGSPMTLAITAPSAAINNGTNANALSFDQRGTGFSRVVENAADMGAFEVQNATPLPTVTSIKVNDGTSVQRSMVTSMTITFSAPVTFPNGIGSAFSLFRTTAIGGGATGSVNVTGTGSGTNVITLTFVNGGAVTLDPAGSLPDGMYSLTLNSNQIAGFGGFLDGNMNGVYQGTAIDNVTSTPFHRLFGDATGDGTVTAADFNAFRLVYGASSFIFDYDGSGQVTATDYNQFRTRYGVSI